MVCRVALRKLVRLLPQGQVGCCLSEILGRRICDLRRAAGGPFLEGNET